MPVFVKQSKMVYLQFGWRKGSKGSSGQKFKGLLSKDFITIFNIYNLFIMPSPDEQT